MNTEHDPLLDRITIKKKAAYDLIEQIVKDKLRYRKYMNRYRRATTMFKSTIHISNAISVSSLLTSVVTVNPFTLIISAIFGSCSSISSACSDALNCDQKFLLCRTTYLQLYNLEKKTTTILLRNSLSSEALDDLLDHLVQNIALINDSAIF